MRRAEAGGPSGRPASGPAARGFVLYSRRDCHLCDEMLAALQDQLGARIPITVVDVDGDPVLAERYGDQVPLLVCGNTEICRYRHDAEKVAAFIHQSR